MGEPNPLKSTNPMRQENARGLESKNDLLASELRSLLSHVEQAGGAIAPMVEAGNHQAQKIKEQLDLYGQPERHEPFESQREEWLTKSIEQLKRDLEEARKFVQEVNDVKSELEQLSSEDFVKKVMSGELEASDEDPAKRDLIDHIKAVRELLEDATKAEKGPMNLIQNSIKAIRKGIDAIGQK